MKCQNCGNEFTGTLEICPVCGLPLDSGVSDEYNAVPINLEKNSSQSGGYNMSGTDMPSGGQSVQTYGDSYQMKQPEQTAGKVYKMRQPVQNTGSTYPSQSPVQNIGGTYPPQQTVQNVGGTYPPQQPVQNAGNPYGQSQNMQQGMNSYSVPQYGQQPMPGYYPQGQISMMTKHEFMKLPSMKKIRTDWNIAWIGLYVIIMGNMLAALITGKLYVLIDVFLLVGLNLGIHIGFNRGCSIAVLVYAIYNFCYLLLAEGKLGGVLILFLGAWAIKATFAFHKEWNSYKLTGFIP